MAYGVVGWVMGAWGELWGCGVSYRAMGWVMGLWGCGVMGLAMGQIYGAGDLWGPMGQTHRSMGQRIYGAL